MTTLPTTSIDTTRTPAQHIDDHEELHEAFNTERIFVTAGALNAVKGSAAASTFSSDVPSWALDQTTAESAGAYLDIPPHWTTMDVYVFAVSTASLGNAVLAYGQWEATASSDWTSPAYVYEDSIVQQFIPNWGEKVQVGDGVSVPTSDFTVFEILRDTDNGSDTLAGDLHITGVLFVKAS